MPLTGVRIAGAVSREGVGAGLLANREAVSGKSIVDTSEEVFQDMFAILAPLLLDARVQLLHLLQGEFPLQLPTPGGLPRGERALPGLRQRTAGLQPCGRSLA